MKDMREFVEDFNIITATDSYKLTHHKMYPMGTNKVSSYFEAREGAEHPYSVWCGLQYLLKKYCVGQVVTRDKIEWAEFLVEKHFGSKNVFNRSGWEHILNNHNGHLPLRIKAVKEGSVIPINNVMMSIENTDSENTYWLTNAIESLLMHVWASTTGATLSRRIKEMQAEFLKTSCDNPEQVLPFMLHDFGYRGSSSHESAKLVGLGHLINYMGTDTVPALETAIKYYNGKIGDDYDIGFSVNATEHSIMTSCGREGEFRVVDELLDKYPTGILAMVIDSYDWVNFIRTMGTPRFKERILARDGKTVFRPDSGEPVVTSHMVYRETANAFGFYTNNKGFEVLNPKVGNLWGDGVGYTDVYNIYANLVKYKISAENYVIGMGGNLHQKINRDTQKNAIKSSYQERNGIGYNIFKDPIDSGKKSKRGRLALVKNNGIYETLENVDPRIAYKHDLLVPIFENGKLLYETNLNEMRELAAL